MDAAGGWAVSSEGACGVPSPWRAPVLWAPQLQQPPKGMFLKATSDHHLLLFDTFSGSRHHPEKARPSNQQNHGPKRWPYANARNLRSSSLWQRGLHRSD